MRGYRDPHPDDEAENVFRFEDQFEDDTFGLTFRRFGRGRPVRVTPDERDECIERFERLEAYFRWTGVAVLIAWMAGSTWWRGDTKADIIGVAGIVAIVVAIKFADHILWKNVTSQFARRAPVGPERTRMDQYRSRAAGLSWSAIALTVLFGGFTLWLADFEHPWRLLESAQVSLALAGVLALALLKLFDRRR